MIILIHGVGGLVGGVPCLIVPATCVYYCNFLALHMETTFALAEGEKMKCKVILPCNEMRGEITENDFYQTLSMYFRL